MTLDVRLGWKVHVKKKKMYWVIGRYFILSTHNKILHHKKVLKRAWICTMQLWYCASESNILIIQRFQNKILRNIINVLWNFRNGDHNRDLSMSLSTRLLPDFRNSREQLNHHINETFGQPNINLIRRFKRLKLKNIIKWEVLLPKLLTLWILN